MLDILVVITAIITSSASSSSISNAPAVFFSRRSLPCPRVLLCLSLRLPVSVLMVVVVCGCVSSAFPPGFIRGIRLLRCLRPLRVIAKSPGLRLVVNTLFKSIGGLGTAAALTLRVWTMFAVLGVQVSAGLRAGVCVAPLSHH